MCLICVEFQKLSISECQRNLTEMRSGLGDHATEVDAMIQQRAMDEVKDDLENFIMDCDIEQQLSKEWSNYMDSLFFSLGIPNDVMSQGE